VNVVEYKLNQEGEVTEGREQRAVRVWLSSPATDDARR
jgi:hypothetical protein